MDIVGFPLLAHVVLRAQASGVFDAVVFATSTDATDDPVAEYCTKAGITCFRGNLNDVLDRYWNAAREQKADVVTRLTADCPLLDPTVIKKVVETFNPKRYDYVSNALERTYPDGLDTETFSMAALTQAHENARLPSEREHVTPYIHTHPELFRIGHVTQERNLSALRWTVDEPQDLDFVRTVFAELGSGIFGQEEILSLLEHKPDLQKINDGIPLNEGYLRSLKEDAQFRNSKP